MTREAEGVEICRDVRMEACGWNGGRGKKGAQGEEASEARAKAGDPIGAPSTEARRAWVLCVCVSVLRKP